MNLETSSYKRPASPSAELSMPPAKIPKTVAGQLQINYLKREKKEIIPLATAEEPLPKLLRLIGEYDGVLQRHESLAGNLGACPVGPILLKRFERLFEGPPRILKSNSRDPNITWLDVVEFAQNKPEQFDLEKTRNGIRVCQFYLKQCRVEISEEDYVLIRSGMPQKLIPPQPILEDEEKELGVIEVLDRNLAKVVHSADQVSARARQLVHRLKNRRAAILARRETDVDVQSNVARSAEPTSASIPFDPNGLTKPPQSQSPPIGFTPVNLRQSIGSADSPAPSSLRNPASEPGRNGSPTAAGTRPDFERFLTPKERAAGVTADTVRRESSATSPMFRSTSMEEERRLADEKQASSSRRNEMRRQSESSATDRSRENQQTSTVPIPNTPASLMPQTKPHAMHRDDGGPYKAEMILRMENIGRGERVIPPCDRCRRLQMDCIKNLTACLGCTKKHAKCSWKDVSPGELDEFTGVPITKPESEAEPPAPTSQDWDAMLKRTKSAPETDKPQSPSTKAGDTIEVASNKPPTSRITSPPTNLARPTSRGHGSPHLDLRPPPLDPPRDSSASNEKPYPQFRPYSRPTQPSTEATSPDEGDRLAALAAQVYRSASQSGRPSES